MTMSDDTRAKIAAGVARRMAMGQEAAHKRVREALPDSRDIEALSPLFKIEALTVYHTLRDLFQRRAALKNVSFDVRDGELLVIIGRSGSGKSTLMDTIKDQFNLHDQNPGQSHVQMGVSAVSIMTGAAEIGRRSRPSQKTRHFLRSGTITVGDTTQSLRMGMGIRGYRAAAKLPRTGQLFLMDERKGEGVYNYKDVGSTARLHNRENNTHIVVTHHLPSIFGYADRILFLHEGEVSWWGTPKDMKDMIQKGSLPNGMTEYIDQAKTKHDWQPEHLMLK